MSAEITDDVEGQEPGESGEQHDDEQVTALRAEAASWRRKLREKEQEFADVEARANDLQGRLDAVTAEADHSRTVAEVAAEAGVPADLLRGSDRAELAAHAEALKAALAHRKGPVVPNIGDQPNIHADPAREFARDLFGSN